MGEYYLELRELEEKKMVWIEMWWKRGCMRCRKNGLRCGGRRPKVWSVCGMVVGLGRKRVTGFGVVPDRSGFVIESRREGEREQRGWFELGRGLHG
jgi:hypothetical protein